MDWEKYRRLNRSIHLRDAFDGFLVGGVLDSSQVRFSHEFLQDVESMQPIVSRQAAAVAIASALSLALMKQ